MTPDEAVRIRALSPRQKEILRLLGRRLEHKEVARELGISPWTVRDHISQARDKLNVTTTRQAILLMMDYEDLDIPPEEGPLSQGIGKPQQISPVSGHEQALHPAEPVAPADTSDPVPRRAGDCPDQLGDAAAPRGHHGHDRDDAVPAGIDGGGAGDHDHLRHSLADRRERPGAWVRWARRIETFKRGLKSAGPARIALTIGVSVTISVFLVGLVVVGIVGTMESLNAFFHPTP